LLFVGSAQAQQRVYHQGELDAMLAPIALQPDGVISQVLIAATYPNEVAAAARWSRANPHLRGDDALRAVQYEPWDPAVKALVAFPDLLLRMDESPQWLHDLGQAFQFQQAHVMDTVQSLRRRAQAAGHLSSTDQYAVYPNGDAIVVEPRTQIVYVRSYDPYVVYGPWWWPHYRPVLWRPWALRPVFVHHGFFYTRPDWHLRHVHVAHRPVHVHHPHHRVVTGKWQHRNHAVVREHHRVPEDRRRAIVQPQHQTPMPAASGFTQEQRRRTEVRREPRTEVRRESRPETRREQRMENRREPQNHQRANAPRWHRS
jgi:hypothetical protein